MYCPTRNCHYLPPSSLSRPPSVMSGLSWGRRVFMWLAVGGLALWSEPQGVPSTFWSWMLCVAAATFGFLLLTWPPANIFMGDVGSTWLAFMVFALALLSVQAGWLSYAAWLVLEIGRAHV